MPEGITRLERDKQDALGRLREIDKTDGHDERFARAQQVAAIETIESELAEKRLALSQSKLFPRKRDAMMVAIGSVVELIDASGRMVRYQLVDSIEANPSDGRISANSPLGKTLIGRTIKETIDWGTHLGKNQLTLISIS